MRYTKLWLASLLALTLFLSACNIGQEPEPTQDVGAIFTAAAETVQAQFASQLTQTALAVPTATPTPTVTSTPTFAISGTPVTPLPTFGIGTQSPFSTLATSTPLGALSTQAGPVCMNSAFVGDVTYPDGTVVKADQRIAKAWQIQNTGTCTWDDGFALIQYAGDNMNSKNWEIKEKKDFVKPNEIKEIVIEMTVPSTKGEHGGCWKMRGDNDFFFGTDLCILIMVE